MLSFLLRCLRCLAFTLLLISTSNSMAHSFVGGPVDPIRRAARGITKAKKAKGNVKTPVKTAELPKPSHVNSPASNHSPMTNPPKTALPSESKPRVPKFSPPSYTRPTNLLESTQVRSKEEWEEYFDTRAQEGKPRTLEEIKEKVNRALEGPTPSQAHQVNAQTQRRRRQTSEQWLAEYHANPEELAPRTKLYNAFQQINQKVKKLEAEGRADEISSADREIVQIWQENTTPKQTPEQWLEIYHTNPKELKSGTKLYKAFENINQKVKTLEEAGRTDEISPAEREIVQLWQENTKRIAAQKTPEQWLAEYHANPEELKNGTKLYQAFHSINKSVKKLTEAGRADEISSAQWEIFRIWQENTKRIAAPKTSEQWWAEYHANPEEFKHGTKLYQAFHWINQKVKILEEAGRADEISSVEREIVQFWQENTTQKLTTHEVYDIFLQFLRENKTYPKGTDSEYRLVYNRLYKNAERLEQIKADRTLALTEENKDLWKLYQLDQLARAAQRGEKVWEVFDKENPLQKPRIGNLRQAFQEQPPDVQNNLIQMEKYYEKLWNEFPTWYQRNKGLFTTTHQTRVAAENFVRTVGQKRLVPEGLDPTISDLLETFDNTFSKQSYSSDGESIFNRVIYRGNNPSFPQAEDFHIVTEEKGISLNLIQPALTQQPPHIKFWKNGNKLTEIRLEEGASIEEIETVLNNILSALPPGWTHRMGAHEVSKRASGYLHIHFEFVSQTGFDTSLTLDINIKRLISNQNSQQALKTIQRHFSKYFTETINFGSW